ncbi:MAG: hypothetical protein KBS43_03650 [Oscillospiraceae bacterium]|nr:hypothetical protein [Candidatus Limimonas coprohippi]
MSYPYVFIHGMLGFGQDEKVNDFLPYWGMLAGDLAGMIRANGGEACAPTISSLGSAWDRACEIYAQLVGGTVDYGEVHSKKYGHARFGRTYDKPLVPGWSSEKKINILGHSFGGATVRMFSSLMAHGAKEEVEASGKDVSELFKGGKGDWIQSVTTVAGPHDGTTVIGAIGPLLPILKVITFFGFAGVLGNTPGNKFYDMSLDQWGITSNPKGKCDYKKMLNIPGMIKAMKTDDNLYFDLSLKGAREINKTMELNKDAYYFSISTSNSMVTPNGNHRTKASSFVPFWLTGNLVGSCLHDRTVDEDLDPLWLESDGCSNTLSALHPSNEPYVYYYDSKDNVQRGIWNVMPVYQGDHMDVVGGSVRAFVTPYYVMNYYKNYFKILDNLK